MIEPLQLPKINKISYDKKYSLGIHLLKGKYRTLKTNGLRSHLLVSLISKILSSNDEHKKYKRINEVQVPKQRIQAGDLNSGICCKTHSLRCKYS
jgi:hypothetical protein